MVMSVLTSTTMHCWWPSSWQQSTASQGCALGAVATCQPASSSCCLHGVRVVLMHSMQWQLLYLSATATHWAASNATNTPELRCCLALAGWPPPRGGQQH